LPYVGQLGLAMGVLVTGITGFIGRRLARGRRERGPMGGAWLEALTPPEQASAADQSQQRPTHGRAGEHYTRPDSQRVVVSGSCAASCVDGLGGAAAAAGRVRRPTQLLKKRAPVHLEPVLRDPAIDEAVELEAGK
jgi:nucleoside-diphosphate-sugar epimerase